ncbi:TetR/AcrR family transcriptional regulator [Actinoplanes rectilineatus]|uniref:TetR/AcrR family transcriptional regulator n=1 Tax=Actinoplanes rectilineatus TaxID=113571 RepID=UPI0005F2EE21|nr:TetR/AcrR family transcriptional regulator [Actinoplanes rectilineatus]
MPGAARVDARRNREIVLRTAMQVFDEDGMDVSLGRIARRAGVGAGTVYRHFPSREILLEAVLAEHLGGLVRAAERREGRMTPGDALFGFLLDAMEKSAGRGAVCEALTERRGWPHTTLAAAVQRFREVLARLLSSARRAGTIRDDVQADDLAALVAGGAALLAAHPSRVRGLRLARVLLDGLRVTKEDGFRDTPAGRRHGTGAADRCGECGERLRLRATGRLPRFCGPTCRQRARRRRLATGT